MNTIKIGDTIYFVSLDNAYYDAYEVTEVSAEDFKINDYCGSYLNFHDCGDRIYIDESDAIKHVLARLKMNYFSLEYKIKNLEHKLKEMI